MAGSEDVWASEFRSQLNRGHLVNAIALLETRRTNHAGTPPQALKQQAIRLIEQDYAKEPSTLVAIAQSFVESDSAGAREIGISLLSPIYPLHAERIHGHLLQVGDDVNWEVREWAASALARIIASHFSIVLVELEAWTDHPLPNIRRMAVVAIGYAMRDVPVETAAQLLGLLTRSMCETEAYICKNLGPFALGSYAMRYHPGVLAEWTHRLDLANESVARNVALMFTAAEAANQLATFSRTLTMLSQDHRPKVRKAIEKALTNLAKRNQQELQAILEI